MAMLPGQRYGKLRWIPDLKAAPGTHPETHPALRTNVSYEERRAAIYNAKDANESHSDLYSKSSFLVNQTAMVKVIVGQSPESTWMVHEALLTAASRFAAAALSWPCKEQEERTIRLPDEDEAIFGLFVHFLYTRK